MSTSVDSLTASSSRITGMYSNMDTDALVTKLCSNQQEKIDNQYKKKTTYEWTQTAWNDITDAINDFSDSYCSTLGSSSMLKSSTYVKYSVSTADTSGALKVTADQNATATNLKVSVSQIAQNSSVTSSSSVSKDKELSSSNNTKLSELGFKNALQFNANGNISFSINDKTFTFDKDTTLQTMISTINADSDADVTMKYSRLTDDFSITANDGGTDSKVIIKNLQGNAFGENSAFGISDGTYKNGSNAKLTIDNGSSSGAVDVEEDSNVFTIDGITYQLRDKTSGEISFNVERDYSSTVDAVQKFADSLNDLLTKLTGYIDAEDYSTDYPPLTEAQKDDMTDDQITKWEDKAKSGILRHNSTLEGLVSSLKNAFFTSAGGTGKNATSIGISTASYFSSNAGQITVDTDALEKALTSNPNQVISIFMGGSSATSSDQQGIMYKLRNTISGFKKTSTQTLTTLSTNITTTKKKIKSLETKLSDMSEKYYEKFSQMETALSKLNSTSSMISSMFSS